MRISRRDKKRIRLLLGVSGSVVFTIMLATALRKGKMPNAFYVGAAVTGLSLSANSIKDGL
ncbi:hypothetical protein L3V43_20575 [Pseudoalteromonas sp. L23]|uniref:hypothetical protein n=1 Tax=unclassified Pseudoalteromonas TaxID=194690 RepID=UPI001EF13674|nr:MULTISPECIES: hypothetical protein [unclassified Pseudoalteromonas]MCF7515980.1 hypothetical protein [Pseudoalteromonas sp. L7]MCF7528048.1 hypothetical protein [Pseudoalteromonas sp. L23]